MLARFIGCQPRSRLKGQRAPTVRCDTSYCTGTKWLPRDPLNYFETGPSPCTCLRDARLEGVVSLVLSVVRRFREVLCIANSFGVLFVAVQAFSVYDVQQS